MILQLTASCSTFSQFAFYKQLKAYYVYYFFNRNKGNFYEILIDILVDILEQEYK